MDKFFELLKVKVVENGKTVYLHDAKDVADHHDVHVNAVYQSRKKEVPDKLDKLYLFDKLVELAENGGGCGDSLVLSGSHDDLINSLRKIMGDGGVYVVSVSKKSGVSG